LYINEQIVFQQLKFVFFCQKAFFKHVHAVKRIGKYIFLLSLPSVFLLSRKASIAMKLKAFYPGAGCIKK
jgi:hypothetical protein